MSVCPFLNKLTPSVMQKTYESLDYPFFTSGDYNVNVFGIRNTENKDSNNFNDCVGLVYKVDGKWQIKKYDATVDPGIAGRLKPQNPNGVAILIPGYYKGAYSIGLHHGKYEALRQVKPMKYWRDNNKDKVLDLSGKEYEELAYTNIHRATAIPGGKSINVDNWSLGCSVIAASNDFKEFMSIIYKARAKYGNSFSYALFTEDQIKF